jgi:hypothetical protein
VDGKIRHCWPQIVANRNSGITFETGSHLRRHLTSWAFSLRWSGVCQGPNGSIPPLHSRTLAAGPSATHLQSARCPAGFESGGRASALSCPMVFLESL